MGTQVQNKPTAAYLLTLIGGVLGLIGGLAVIVIGAFLQSFLFDNFGVFGFPTGLFVGLGIWALICSALLIFFAIKLNAEPMEHSKWGALILIFAIIGSFNLIALVGGILALVYKPIPYGTHPAYGHQYAAPPGYMPPQSTYTQPVQKPETKVCPQCGRIINENTKFCPYCGKQLI